MRQRVPRKLRPQNTWKRGRSWVTEIFRNLFGSQSLKKLTFYTPLKSNIDAQKKKRFEELAFFSEHQIVSIFVGFLGCIQEANANFPNLSIFHPKRSRPSQFQPVISWARVCLGISQSISHVPGHLTQPKNPQNLSTSFPLDIQTPLEMVFLGVCFGGPVISSQFRCWIYRVSIVQMIWWFSLGGENGSDPN